MDFLRNEFAGNSIAAYIAAFLVASVIVIAVLTARWILVRRLLRLASRTETVYDDFVVRLLQRINPLVVAVIAISIAARALELPDKVAHGLGVASIGAVFFQIGLWGETLIRLLTTKSVTLSAGGAVDSPAQKAVIFLGRLLLWSLVFVLLLENVGVDLSALLAGLGIGGIAIALAVQNILGDLFCFVAIILDKPFEYGDFVIVDDKLGTIEKIGIKTTRVRALGGEQLIFSNSDLIASRIRNFKRMSERRIVFQIGVTYDTPTRKLSRIPKMITDLISEIPDTRFDRAHFVSFGDFSLNFEIVYYVLDSDYNHYMDIQQKINLALCSAFEAEKIEFAFPTQTLHVQGTMQKAMANS